MQILKKLSLWGVKEVKGTEVSQVLSHTPVEGAETLSPGHRPGYNANVQGALVSGSAFIPCIIKKQ